MKLYQFDQNNSAGVWKGPARIVLVEALSPEDALSVAEDFGVYLDGVSSGEDCKCCGDRWYRRWFGESVKLEDLVDQLSMELEFMENHSWYLDEAVPAVFLKTAEKNITYNTAAELEAFIDELKKC